MSDDATPNTPSAAYQKMLPRWTTINTVLEGTEALRAAGETFLPRHVAEEDNRYSDRLRTSVLRNMTEDTLDSLCGKPFSEPIRRGDDIPANVADILDNIDAMGRNIDSFAKKWFRSGVAKGFCHVLVEYPRIQGKPDGSPRTLDDDRRDGIRPYLVRIEPENLIYLRTENINGNEFVTHARIRRTAVVPNPENEWVDMEIIEVIVLEPGLARVYQPADPEKPDDEWIQVEAWNTGLGFVPLITFYTNHEETMEAKPPLLDLAYVNLAHWQSSSDQRSILSTARLPILAGSGIAEEEAENLVIGPYQFLSSSNEGSKFYYVEHQGKAIEAGAKDLASLEEWMASAGAEFLKRKPGNMTATGRALDSAESLSKVQAWVLDFEDCLSIALSYLSAWMTNGTNFDGGSVTLVSDFNIGETDSAELDALNKARERRDISRYAYLEEMKRRDILPETYDAELDAELLQEEAAAMPGLGGTDLNLDDEPDDDDDPDDDVGGKQEKDEIDDEGNVVKK